MRTLVLVLSAIYLVCPLSSAIASTEHVTSPDQPVQDTMAELLAWPEGVLELVNDPLRTDGWYPWFSELPNDVYVYEFKPQTSDDVNAIIAKFAAIEGDSRRILLSAEPELRVVGHGKTFPEGHGTAATFSIGSQRVLDRWFGQLPESEPGIREFGVHRYTESPTAMPPTLTLYVGHSAVVLDDLVIPEDIELGFLGSESYREKHAGDPVLWEIDAFLAERQGASPKPAP